MNRFFLIVFFLTGLIALFRCNSDKAEQDAEENTNTYLNLHDSAKYVGIHSCKPCHQDIYNSFLQTGMGKSFDIASKKKSAAKFDQHSIVYDKSSDFFYKPFLDKDSLKIMEFRLDKKDTIYKRIETVDYIIGSGQHTNSHISNTNGYLHQMPMTFYTQKGTWDLPPGFENGANSRFSRKIGLECMSCHNAYPDFVMGSENKYASVPNGIDCERCHGPGSIHIDQKSRGIVVDTAKKIDYTIVNPAKLSIDLQFDVCQRCHLQGNAVLKENKSFFDYKPGMKLSDVLTVFMPRYENSEKDFIMASHADRLKMSECYLSPTLSQGEGESSHKNKITCITCHDPHVSVKVTGKEVFNNACKNCHGNTTKVICAEKQEVRNFKQDNCVSCHMPRSGSIDIPHVSITDHFIRKPVTDQELIKVKKFIGLYAVNEKNPDNKTKAQAYLNQYEKFDTNPALLDSAEKYLSDKTKKEIAPNLNLLVQLQFMRKDFQKIVRYLEEIGIKEALTYYLNQKTWSNDDAWTCYRIGEAYGNSGQSQTALLFYKQAVALAPHSLDFKNKLAGVYFGLNEIETAKYLYESIVKENPKFASAYCNLGYCFFIHKNYKSAEELYIRALALDPDYEQALLNTAQLFVIKQEYEEAIVYLKKILRRNPSNIQAKQALEQLKNS